MKRGGGLCWLWGAGSDCVGYRGYGCRDGGWSATGTVSVGRIGVVSGIDGARVDNGILIDILVVRRKLNVHG